jgi:hypothetical protein
MEAEMTRSILGVVAVLAVAGAVQAEVLITEVMYDPALGNEHEYVELYNNGTEAVDLTGYVLRDDPGQEFPNAVTLTGGTIPPGETAVLIRIDDNRTRANYESAWGADLNFVEVTPWPVYSNGGDKVELLDPSATVVATVPYAVTNGYPFPDDSASIYMIDPEAVAPYAGSNWALSTVGVDCAVRGNAPRSADVGSPGYLPGSTCGAPAPLLITEIMYDPNLNNEHEYVEVYNNTDHVIDLTGWVLSDNPAQTFPNPVTLTGGLVNPGCTAVLIRIDHARFLVNYQLAWGVDVNFIEVQPWPVFTNGGDVVELSDPDGNVVASVNYDFATGGFPFPADGPSIYMLDHLADDLYGADNWDLSQDGIDGARLGDAPRANDTGSPGCVPFIRPGDCNADGLIDAVDFEDAVTCLGGPDVPVGGGCVCFDLNADDSVSLVDIAEFQLRFGCNCP